LKSLDKSRKGLSDRIPDEFEINQRLKSSCIWAKSKACPMAFFVHQYSTLRCDGGIGGANNKD